jgi:hypothetical protein
VSGFLASYKRPSIFNSLGSYRPHSFYYLHFWLQPHFRLTCAAAAPPPSGCKPELLKVVDLVLEAHNSTAFAQSHLNECFDQECAFQRNLSITNATSLSATICENELVRIASQLDAAMRSAVSSSCNCWLRVDDCSDRELSRATEKTSVSVSVHSTNCCHAELLPSPTHKLH